MVVSELGGCQSPWRNNSEQIAIVRGHSGVFNVGEFFPNVKSTMGEAFMWRVRREFLQQQLVLRQMKPSSQMPAIAGLDNNKAEPTTQVWIIIKTVRKQ